MHNKPPYRNRACTKFYRVVNGHRGDSRDCVQTKFVGGNVKMKVKRIIAGLLAMVMLLTAALPTSNVKAASGTASLDSLGKLGTVNVGIKK